MFSTIRKSQSVYYFSFIKLKVSTFLVYKVKKCLLKSGKVNFNHQASSPEALPNFAQDFGHLCPELSVNSAHVLGHPCSCTRA